MRGLTQKECETLESMIDVSSLNHVLESLATIAREKSEHIESNWQDAPSARAWRSAAKSIDRAAESVTAMGV